jgi:hypothetical protein
LAAAAGSRLILERESGDYCAGQVVVRHRSLKIIGQKPLLDGLFRNYRVLMS